MISLSLKTKMSVAVSLLVVVLMASLAFLISTHFHHRFKEAIAAQQFALVTEMTRDVDETIDSVRETLVGAAASFPRHAVEEPVLAQRFLQNWLTLRELFDNGIFLFSSTGRMIAEYPDRRRRGTDVSFRKYFRETIATGKPHVSDPYISSQPHHHPCVMFTAPLLDEKGKIIAVLAGSLDLTKDNFLGEHSRIKIGRTGYIYFFSTDRTIIMHPDRSRVLKRDVPVGTNRVFDKAIAGFEGTEETVNSRGLHALTSVRHLKSVNWILAANYPLAEAYAPVREATRYSILASIIGGIISVVTVWLAMKALTSPLLHLTRHIRGLSENGGVGKEIRVRTADEIAELATAFNILIARLDRKQRKLRHMSTHDMLTGLYSRAFFDEEMDRLARGRKFPVSIISADLDGLKNINDTLGHAAGDRLLKVTARIFFNAFRAEDVVARIGGDEFAVLLPETDIRSAEAAVERLRKCRDEENELCTEFRVSISVGVATAERQEDLLKAFKLSDERMYLEKFARKERSASGTPDLTLEDPDEALELS
jgi:diguanylate cyclase (GGDEF)-like protein